MYVVSVAHCSNGSSQNYLFITFKETCHVNLSVASLDGVLTVAARLVSIAPDLSMMYVRMLLLPGPQIDPGARRKDGRRMTPIFTLALILTPYLFSLYRARYCIAPCLHPDRSISPCERKVTRLTSISPLIRIWVLRKDNCIISTGSVNSKLS
jgi:hypothetical protein